MPSPLDHLVFATPNLAATIAWFAEATGIHPAEGGRHDGRGTRNYLVGLGPTAYLEIIGPDLERPATEPVPFGIDRLEGERLVTWAIHPDDIESAAVAARKAGAELGPIVPMSRTTPAGDVLSWRLTAVQPAPYDGVVPFLIDWGTSRHPAASGLPAAELVEFDATHPRAAEVSVVLDVLKVGLPVSAGEPGLRAVIAGPEGTCSLR
jgi:catechol 2,3-dioxygenase-like lactoylglutathione lyase family enzyme